MWNGTIFVDLDCRARCQHQLNFLWHMLLVNDDEDVGFSLFFVQLGCVLLFKYFYFILFYFCVCVWVCA